MMTQLAKVLLAQPEEGGAVELGIAAHRVVGVRVQFLAIAVMPDLYKTLPL